MTNTIKSLCGNCKKHCTLNLRTEYALRRNLTYIYLNNGNKIINGCSQYTGDEMPKTVTKPAMPSIDAPRFSHPPKLNFAGGLNLAGFKSYAAKI